MAVIVLIPEMLRHDLPRVKLIRISSFGFSTHYILIGSVARIRLFTQGQQVGSSVPWITPGSVRNMRRR
jgi:hypothetical protein